MFSWASPAVAPLYAVWYMRNFMVLAVVRVGGGNATMQQSISGLPQTAELRRVLESVGRTFHTERVDVQFSDDASYAHPMGHVALATDNHPDEPKPQQFRLLVDTLSHEIEHVRESNLSGKQEMQNDWPEAPNLAAHVANILEDQYIDWTRTRRLPGLRSTLAYSIDYVMADDDKRPPIDGLPRAMQFVEGLLQLAFAGVVKGVEDADPDVQEFLAWAKEPVDAVRYIDAYDDRKALMDDVVEKILSYVDTPDLSDINMAAGRHDGFPDDNCSRRDANPQAVNSSRWDADDDQDQSDDDGQAGGQPDGDADDEQDGDQDSGHGQADGDGDDGDAGTDDAADGDDAGQAGQDGAGQDQSGDAQDGDRDAGNTPGDDTRDGDAADGPSRPGNTSGQPDLSDITPPDMADDDARRDALEEWTGTQGIDRSDYDGVPDHIARRYDQFRREARRSGDDLKARETERDERVDNFGTYDAEAARNWMKQRGLDEDVRDAFEQFATADMEQPARGGALLNIPAVVRRRAGDLTETELYLEHDIAEAGDRVVGVTLDLSGSMQGTLTQARAAVAAVAIATEEIGDDFAANGFTGQYSRDKGGWTATTPLITSPDEHFEFDHLAAAQVASGRSRTPTPNGIYDIADVVDQASKGKRRVVIVVTDGEPNVPFRKAGEYGYCSDDEAQAETKQAVNELRNDGYAVIAPAIGDDDHISEHKLREAYGPDGYVRVQDDADITQALVDIYVGQLDTADGHEIFTG